MRLIVIDGYNVIYASPWLKSLLHRAPLAAQQELAERVVAYAAGIGVQALVVYDAHTRGREERWEAASSLVQVVWTARGVTADSFIEEYIASGKQKYSHVSLITRDLQQGFTVLDKDVIPRSPARFLQELEAAAGELISRQTHEKSHFFHPLISKAARARLRELHRQRRGKSEPAG